MATFGWRDKGAVGVKALLFTSLIALAVTAWSPKQERRWHPLLVDSDTNTVLVDLQSLQKTGASTWQAWTKWEYPKGKSLPSSESKKYAYAVRLSQFDCANRRDRTKDIVYYYLGGEVLDTDMPKDWPAWGEVVPESIGEVVHREFCAYIKNRASK